jgi:hypothetical protein
MPHGICPHSLISQSCTTMSVEQVRCIALEESRHSLTKESTRAFKDAQCARLVACKAPRTCASLNVPDLLLQAAVPWPARHSPRHSRYQTQIREPNMQAATRSGQCSAESTASTGTQTRRRWLARWPAADVRHTRRCAVSTTPMRAQRRPACVTARPRWRSSRRA